MTIPYDKKQKYQLLDEVGFRDYFKAGSWPEFNRQFFDGLAPKYDRLNEVLSLGQHQRIKKHALKRLNIKRGSRILDLCTGSGDIALHLAYQYPDCAITGLDASSKMLDVARQRAHDRGLARIEWVQGDVLNLPFADGSFDFVIISFGLRNLDDLRQGLREMKRVLKPGGLFLNLDLGAPEHPLLKVVHEAYFRKLIPWLGKVIFHRGEFNSFHYLPASGKYFPHQRELVGILEEAGFNRVERRDYMLGAISSQVASA